MNTNEHITQSQLARQHVTDDLRQLMRDAEQLIAAADKAMATAGTQASVSWGSATASQEVATQIFAIKPAAAAAAEVAKMNGIATSSLAKYNGIAKASVAKKNGKTV